ncbi:DUF4150 domain-containing protein [Sulfidibacter corallicola]|uniref:DUF4150 domain-containing protein n=1 Tax=Sulfidibacter corallicola TaxID=2818388 RepID=A0A8A4TGZ3_SULCO|nr:DUF4150 domain-containing protein [Sulfidibacter corallicola]QTD48787.1 DUF4150 domain-containing protein [Sulfidibacter corallicola]
MIPTVNVNDLSIVHKKSDGVATNSAPDVCWTPGPNPKIPIPYPNFAYSKDLVNGSRTVSADGASIALKRSEFCTSTGDEGGTAGGGIISGVIKGKAKFVNYSMDVKIEGNNVARLSDMMTMNGNAPNTAGPELQGLKNVVGEDAADILCRAFCWCDNGGDGGDFAKTRPVMMPLRA